MGLWLLQPALGVASHRFGVTRIRWKSSCSKMWLRHELAARGFNAGNAMGASLGLLYARGSEPLRVCNIVHQIK
jgi:hypothetical protein